MKCHECREQADEGFSRCSKHRAKNKSSAQALRDTQPERERAKTRLYRARHPERHLASCRRWVKSHPEQVRVFWLRRRARKLNAAGSCTVAQLRARITLYGGLCWVPGCGKGYEHIDHVIPLAKGGTNWPSNLRPICKHHNHTKSAALPAAFLERTS